MRASTSTHTGVAEPSLCSFADAQLLIASRRDSNAYRGSLNARRVSQKVAERNGVRDYFYPGLDCTSQLEKTQQFRRGQISSMVEAARLTIEFSGLFGISVP